MTHDQFMNLRDGYITHTQGQLGNSEKANSHEGYLSDDLNDKMLVGAKRRGKKIRRPPPLPIGYNTLGMDENRKVLYRNFHDVSDKLYLIEISRNKTKVFICLFENYASPDEFIAEVLSEKLAFALMARHDNLFENFVRSFYIAYGRLQIEGHHHKVVEQKSYTA